MGKKFDLVVFDWDGTLLDSTAAIVEAIQAACRDLGLPEPAEAQARYVIGLGLGDVLRLCAPTLAVEHSAHMTERYKTHYLARDRELRLFAGAGELVAELHAAGVTLAVATGKSRLGLNRALASSGLGSFFSATRCADECFSKPHPQMLDELMNELSVAPEQTLMVGDTTHDLQMAINAGVAGLAVAYGAHPVSQLDALNPIARVDDLGALTEWLRRHT